MTPDVTKIAALNDALRKTLMTGLVVLTEGVRALPEATRKEVVTRVRTFDRFSIDNDPHGEHDFGAATVDGVKVFWKIDYYDRTLSYGSDDPADPAKTCRKPAIARIKARHDPYELYAAFAVVVAPSNDHIKKCCRKLSFKGDRPLPAQRLNIRLPPPSPIL